MTRSQWRLSPFWWAAIALGAVVLSVVVVVVVAVIVTSTLSMRAEIEALRQEPTTTATRSPDRAPVVPSTAPSAAPEPTDDPVYGPAPVEPPTAPVPPAPRKSIPEPAPVCPIGQVTVTLDSVNVTLSQSPLPSDPEFDIFMVSATVRVTNNTNLAVDGSARTSVSSGPITLRDRLIAYSPGATGALAPGGSGLGGGTVTAQRSELDQITSWYVAEATGTFWYQDLDLRCTGAIVAPVVIG